MTREDAAAAVQGIAQTPDGATLINYLVGRFGFARTSTFSTDHAEMAYREGQRSVVQHIGVLLDLDLTPRTELNDGPRNDSDPGPDIDTGAGDLYDPTGRAYRF